MSDEDMNRASNPRELAVPRQRGITIIEIMVTLAIASVLVGLALPAFNAFVAQRTLTAQVNDFMVAIQYARSEASRRGTTVSVQAETPTAGNEWGAGWCVLVGAPGACPNPPDGTELRIFPGLGNNTLAGVAPLDGVGTLAFSARGLLLPPAAAGTFNLCNPDRDVGREISISLIGRISSREPPVAELDCQP
jgi:type IV fimbrial biogenesis protein FimT